MYSKEVETLIENSIKYNGENYGCLTTQQYEDLLKIIGIDKIKTNLLDLKVGDLIYDFYDNENPLKLVWTSIEDNDNYKTILNKRCVPLKEVLFPKEMKKIYPLVVSNYADHDYHGFDATRGEVKKTDFPDMLKRITNVKIRKGTFVESCTDDEKNYTEIRHRMCRNFLHMTFLIIKPMNFVGVSSADIEKYIQRVNVLVQRDWKTKSFRIVSVYGAPFKDGIDPLDGSFIKLEKKNGEMLSIKFILNKEPVIGDFTYLNSTTRLISAYETW